MMLLCRPYAELKKSGGKADCDSGHGYGYSWSPRDGASSVSDLLAPVPARRIAAGTRPTFSVIVAAYQVAHLIGDAIESALAQELPPYEIVVCDDGSTDDLEGALAPYRDRIVLLRKRNGGEASAKNAAARAARGEFVAILDADDVFAPDRLKALADAAAARPDLDILTTDAYLVVNGRPVRRCYEPGFSFEVEDQRQGILERNFIFGLAAVRRERLVQVGGFDESIRYTADWDCWLRMILDGSRAGLVPRPLAHYRLRAGSLTSQRPLFLAGALATAQKAARRHDLTPAERRTVAETVRRYRARVALAGVEEALVERRPDARRQSLRVALDRAQPLPTRTKAVASAVAPRVAGRFLRRRDVELAAGMLVPSDAVADAPTASAVARR